MKTTRNTRAVRSLSPSPSEPRDLFDPLVRRAAAGDRNAIGALARSFRRQLFAAAREHVPSFDAEDVVQDLFVLLLERNVVPPSADEPAVAWLLHTVATLAGRNDPKSTSPDPESPGSVPL